MRAGLLFSAFSLCVAAPALAADPTDAIFQVERDFAAFTHDHGYTKGFFTYSAPEAVDFEPQAHKIHDELAAAVAADPTEKDAPSKLLWRPYIAGIADSQDLAWDMGPWTIDGTQKAGWFMTLWQKQDDGTWRWIFDGGAGSDTPENLPADGQQVVVGTGLIKDVTPAQATAATLRRDAQLDANLAKMAPGKAYKSFWQDGKIVAAGDAGPPARDKAAVIATLSSRPQGATWIMDYAGVSASADMAYTVGHTTGADGAYLGHYVRVWCKTGLADSAWTLVADDYQSAK